ncbi:hypothetical protein PYH58_11960 [Mammaliicoccus sciuri]|uniref:hypothetical protein n=1 Tax=Mammaliicoccus sciuri TaxID=1296 RepID=UPI003364CFAF
MTKNAKQVLLSAYNEVEKDDKVIVITIREDESDESYITLIDSSVTTHIERLGILENAKEVLHELNN